MHARHWILGFAIMVASACGDSAAPEPRSGNDGDGPNVRDPEGDRKAMTPKPSAGGATGDFSGDCNCDALERELALDEPDEVLGFSGEDVLARIEGEYALPIVWSDQCAGAEGKAARGCDVARPAFTGSETEVRVSIAATASGARVVECNRGASAECHSVHMYLPVTGTLTSADGLLDETFELEIATDSLAHIGVGAHSEAADVHGELASEVESFAGIEWRFDVSDTQAIFEVFVLSDGDGFSRGLLVSRAPEGGTAPDGHTWGVALDLEEARQ